MMIKPVFICNISVNQTYLFSHYESQENELLFQHLLAHSIATEKIGGEA